MNNQIFIQVKPIINEWDPAGLLAIHCPDDEYHSEIREICHYIESLDTKDYKLLGLHIYKTFKDYLGNEFQETEEKCFEISLKIYKGLNKQRFL
ncbi:hypothetical protein MUG84_00160 [Paenibacillus sp. KQZ6P-2]|uniref:DUF1871 domain-containing protein n=1 Tax=Paenibacillus mangrovi TaxID=2931978 RepID=A0A9X1WM41_9BACL|nr:hypothetical protein [Paenibacillus mangrovi]MCJ8010153.1 hypothetical protein [Paenibacillus mangrovi]